MIALMPAPGGPLVAHIGPGELHQVELAEAKLREKAGIKDAQKREAPVEHRQETSTADIVEVKMAGEVSVHGSYRRNIGARLPITIYQQQGQGARYEIVYLDSASGHGPAWYIQDASIAKGLYSRTLESDDDGSLTLPLCKWQVYNGRDSAPGSEPAPVFEVRKL